MLSCLRCPGPECRAAGNLLGDFFCEKCLTCDIEMMILVEPVAAIVLNLTTKRRDRIGIGNPGLLGHPAQVVTHTVKIQPTVG